VKSLTHVAAAFAWLAIGLATADVRLPAIFGNDMVLQRDADATVWGWGAPDEIVTVVGSWNGKPAKATADADGRWKAAIKTGPAGGPYDLTVHGQNLIELKNVMLGEVWLCSGQSNMEWSVGPSVGPGIANHVEEIKNATNANLRFFTVQKARAAKPAEDCTGKWQVCSPESVVPFSAAAYFFGRKLQEELKVPIGLIASSWGGTEVELWISEPAMRTVPDLAASIDGRAAGMEKYQRDFTAWMEECQKADPGWETWAGPSLDDKDWTALPKLASFEQHGLGQFDGTCWYRAAFSVPESWRGKAAEIDLGAIDDFDVTWVNGRKVGSTASHAAQRKYALDAGLIQPGQNTLVVRVHDFMGQGGFSVSGDQPCVRCGTESAPITAWRYKVGVDQKQLKPPPASNAKENSSLYNAMIAPLTPLAIRGAIWYQGEANVFRAEQYRTSFPLMIADWRKAFGRGDFPFYFVQIAPFDYHAFRAGDPADTWPHPSAELRDAQRAALATPNTGMIVVTDITDDVRNIHPMNKQDVGARLAAWALAKAYNHSGVAYSGPLYKSMTVDGDRIRLAFDHTEGGLVAAGSELKEFTIAGEDHKFVSAKAVIDGEFVIVSSPAVAKPLAVRVGWTDTSIPNLFNKAGLPASPFRTDDWPTSTTGVKW
jgi:sialate O-acetylesterase